MEAHSKHCLPQVLYASFTEAMSVTEARVPVPTGVTCQKILCVHLPSTPITGNCYVFHPGIQILPHLHEFCEHES